MLEGCEKSFGSCCDVVEELDAPSTLRFVVSRRVGIDIGSPLEVKSNDNEGSRGVEG